MAMRLLFHSQNNRKNMGGIVTLKRETLLYGYKLDIDPEAILSGDNPQRALEYWTKAISILKEFGVIATIEEPPFPKTKDGKKKAQGWQKEWVQQSVTITMEDNLKHSLDEVRDKYQKRSLKIPKKSK
jgi:sugar phosphate isomerase/epimerase